ncbi:MAG: DUF559 domain-containing protein [Propionibacteriaceae bacterium]
MTANQQDIERILRSTGGIMVRRQHPRLARSLSHLVSEGTLRPVLPGVYVEASLHDDLITRLRAAAAWDPDAVLTGAAAARITFWPDISVGAIGLAVRSGRRPQPGFVFSRRLVPPELIVQRQGIRCTIPAMTALDLCDAAGPEALDIALRRRAATVPGLYEALRLTSGRRGNGQRREFLVESRDNAWSPAERAAQRLFKAEGLVGWIGNYPLPLVGQTYYLDFAFPEARLAVEIDGRSFHSSPEAFERDRWRQNDIVLAGWRVLRFTPAMLEQQPHVVIAVIRRALQELDAR